MVFLEKEAVSLAPEIRRIDHAIAAIQSNLKGYRRERILPNVAFSAELNETLSRAGAGSTVPGGLSPVDDTAWSANLNLSLPVFQGGLIKTGIAKSNLQIEQLEYQKNYLIQQISLKVRAALLNLVTLSVNKEKSRISADLAKKNLLLVQDAYAKGKVSITSLADAQNTWVNADLNASNSGYMFLTGLFQMERAVGRYFVLMPESKKAEYTQRVIAELGQE
jgi:outer membrane protein TolC